MMQQGSEYESDPGLSGYVRFQLQKLTGQRFDCFLIFCHAIAPQ